MFLVIFGKECGRILRSLYYYAFFAFLLLLLFTHGSALTAEAAASPADTFVHAVKELSILLLLLPAFFTAAFFLRDKYAGLTTVLRTCACGKPRLMLFRLAALCLLFLLPVLLSLLTLVGLLAATDPSALTAAAAALASNTAAAQPTAVTLFAYGLCTLVPPLLLSVGVTALSVLLVPSAASLLTAAVLWFLTAAEVLSPFSRITQICFLVAAILSILTAARLSAYSRIDMRTPYISSASARKPSRS